METLDGWKAAEILLAVMIGFLGWWGARLQNKVDRSVTQRDFNTGFKDSKEERLALHKENTENFRRLYDKLDEQKTHAFRILECEKKVEQVRVYCEDLKHDHIDPYEGAVLVLKSRVDALEKRGVA
jgi:hypothetical protein